MTRQLNVLSLAGLCLFSATLLAAQPPAAPQAPAAPPAPAAATQDPAADLVKQAQGALREGNYDQALKILHDAMAKAPAGSPSAFNVHSQMGVVLDLMGRYGEARSHFAKAAEMAQKPEDKARATRNVAMSYGFERNCDGAVKAVEPLYQANLAANEFFAAGEVANEVARVCLESGTPDQAATWYKRGYDAGVKEPNITPARKDLWDFRMEHALARIAARRGQAAEAQKHVAAAKAIFDKGTNPEQAQFVPYLVGYVAFYGGDYKTALAELQKGNQNDVFIMALMAQAYEMLGQKDQATELYKKILQSSAHNPTNAYARPLAKERLGMK